MKKPSKHIITYALLVVVSGMAIYFFLHSGSLEDQLDEAREKIEVTSQKNAFYQSVDSIDSLLLEGNYEKARDAYKAALTNGDDSLNYILKLRIQLAENLIRQREIRKNAMDSSEFREPDSLTANRLATPEEVRRYDSLNFALAKANTQINNLKRQLQRKTSGEYLTFTTAKGNKVHYVGEVKNGKANGSGVALFNTGSRYVGEWKDNMKHGEGTFYWPDGEYYVGNYKNDQRHGMGTYHWPNGDRFTGQWADNHRNGPGTFYNKEGEVIASGIWKDDELVEVEKQ
ncbi:MAG: hypothetical protein R3345_06875 [Fulvivirga sp.]|nr:hypothetical protein [Fulvivirga sp.]